jgi:UDP-N-acetylglucosamine transferase subunit ALG13
VETVKKVLSKSKVLGKHILGDYMIFVSVGTQKFQFNRLLLAVDSEVTVLEKMFGLKVFMQTGYSTCEIQHAQYKRFLSPKEFSNAISNSDLVITHAGVGTIMMALKQSKPVIVAPRLKKYNEHVDDHQVEIAQQLSDKVVDYMPGDDLILCVKSALQHKGQSITTNTPAFASYIERFIKETFND